MNNRIFSVIGTGILVLSLLVGCRAPLNCVLVGSGTTVGFDVSEAAVSQTPQATLAYKRIEMVIVPVNTNGETPDVIMDFSFKTSIFTAGGGIYSRVAVGKNATTQTPAALMMAKGRDGNLCTNFSLPLPSQTIKTNK